MSALTREAQESAFDAGSSGVRRTLEGMVLNIEGGDGQTLRPPARVLASSVPGGDRVPARRSNDAVLPVFADLRSLPGQAHVPLALVYLGKQARTRSFLFDGSSAAAVISTAAAFFVVPKAERSLPWELSC